MDFDELEITPAIEEKLWVKHRVTVDEVEEALLNPHIEKRKPGDTRRRYIYEKTEAGRYLFVVVEQLAPRHFFLLTAMDMDQGERKKYGARLKKLPKFTSWQQEEQFWETHSTADYVFAEVPAEAHLRLNPRRTVRRRMRAVRLKNPFAA